VTAEGVSEHGAPAGTRTGTRVDRYSAAAVWLTVAALAIEVLALLARLVIDLPRYGDIGYPDSATMIRITGFMHHGELFPPLDRPPYLVTVYGPLTYLFFGVPYAAAEVLGANPVLGMRLTHFGSVVACVSALAVLTRRFDRSALILLLAIGFAASGAPLRTWVLQLRGDFLGLFLSLSCIALCAGENTPRRPWGSAVLAGLAILTKQTFIAAPLAVVVWLLWQKQIRHAAVWAGMVCGVVVLGYGIMLLREPDLISHVMALRDPVFEYRSGARLLFTAAMDIRALYGIAGAAVLLRAGGRAAQLIVLYWGFSWLVAAATIPQIGGNVNYFWEPWFMSSLLAAVVVGVAMRQARRIPLVIGIALVLLHFRAIGGGVLAAQGELRNLAATRARTEQQDRALQSLALAVRGYSVLSSDPLFARHSRVPVVPDPYLTSALMRMSSWDPAPVLAAVRNAEFDVVIGYDLEDLTLYRGLASWNPLRVEHGRHPYTVVCRMLGEPVWFSPSSPAELRQRVADAGCM
jgi:hypothetical protein